MTEEKEKKQRQCVVKSKQYRGSYYDGNAGFHSEFTRAKIYNENELPAYIKEDKSRYNVIFFDTKEGLELLAEEYKHLQDYVDIYESRVNEAKEGMEKLWNNSEKLRKYVERYNKSYHQLIGVSENTKRRILEEVVNSKD